MRDVRRVDLGAAEDVAAAGQDEGPDAAETAIAGMAAVNFRRRNTPRRGRMEIFRASLRRRVKGQRP